ncbi:FAD:protein FMN transferase [Spongisporangium articulatum]|uniref:FAD:protein FMN transferase n=1 Tax=Spongisporangium articulatum TaxID=3362603 RepID=A0ABW8AI54_9ACTN
MAALHVIDGFARDDAGPGPGAGCPPSTAWTAWGADVQVAVTDPHALRAARRLARRELAAAEKAAYRHRPDAEIHALYRAGGRAITVSPLLTELVAAALATAERTGGDVDPTVAAAVTRLAARGSTVDLRAVPTCAQFPRAAAVSGRGVTPRPPGEHRAAPRSSSGVAGWETVRLAGRRLQVPAGVTLDLTATAKAFSCDRAATRIADRLGVGVSVAVGGYVATAGPAPAAGWLVPLDDVTLALPAGTAMAVAHAEGLVDPLTGEQVSSVWSTVMTLGLSCLEAAGHAAAAVVRGPSARAWLTELGVPARMVTVHSDALTVAGWDRHARPIPASDRQNPSHRGVPAPRLANPQRTNLR